jgi:hypothetical protein
VAVDGDEATITPFNEMDDGGVETIMLFNEMDDVVAKK